MHGDNLDNDNTYEDEDNNDDFPLLNITELKRDNEIGEIHDIEIKEKTIQSLREIVAVADKHNMSVNIQECVLMEVQIDSANIDISFNESVFKEKIQFKNGVFGGKLNFYNSTFEEEADFSGAIFKKDIDFEECTFHKKLNFFGAIFEKNAAFSSCYLKAEITFDGASFEGEVDFSESTFRKKAIYNRAIFKKPVDLSGTLFEESLEITGSNLPDMKKRDLADQRGHEQRFGKEMRQATQFDLSDELDRVLKKKISRRQILRGIFRFLPEDKEK